MLNIQDIRTSVENQQSFILDEHAKSGTFLRDPRGRLIAYTGGFSVVFPYHSATGEKWAFRCWHSELGSLQSHFHILSTELQKLNLPYFCPFDYCSEGIVVEGRKYPTTRMKWVEGCNIKEFICQHRTEKQKLKLLAANFLEMAQTLHRHNIAHGDLQHGNILVADHDRLFLIDYDSVYLPELKGQADIITGLKGYQHPNRSENKSANEKLDYFSELIIYTSFLAVAENPSLADKYKLEDVEQLLFSPEDFDDLPHSSIYYDLRALKGIFPDLLNLLQQYLAEDDINNLKPFDVLMDEKYSSPTIKFFRLANGPKVIIGKTATLEWEVDNTSELYLNGEAYEVYQKKHKVPCKELGIQHFELLAINGLHRVQAVLDIEVVEGAVISFTSNTRKLKRGKNEQATLQWSIKNAKSAILIDVKSEYPIKKHGSKIVNPETTTIYQIVAEDKDGLKTTEKLKIHVIDEAKVFFDADKKYTFPSIPFKLTWDVACAREVKLNGVKVEHSGSQLWPEIDKDTTFVLSVRDAFGTRNYPLVIRILPLPIIKSIMVPAPKIEKKINIVCNVLSPNLNIQLKPLKLIEPTFPTSTPHFVQPPNNVTSKTHTKIPLGIVERLGSVWHWIDNNVLHQTKRNQ